MWKENDPENQGYGHYYCDVLDCQDKGVKVLTLRNAGLLTRHIGDDRFDVCWKHYIETLERFRQVRNSLSKEEKTK